MSESYPAAMPAEDVPTRFGDALQALVSGRIAELVDRHAVDEANGDVLDRLIDHAVAQEQARIAQDSVRRSESLSATASRLEAEREQAEWVERGSLDRASRAARKIRALMSALSASDESVEDPGDHIDVSAVRALSAGWLDHWTAVKDAALRTAGVSDASQLAGAADSARLRLQSSEAELGRARQRYERALREKEAALQYLGGQLAVRQAVVAEEPKEAQPA